MNDAQQTLVLIKPDAVRRGLVGEIIRRYEAKGLVLEALELRTIDAAFADRHYAEHVEKPWYPGLRARHLTRVARKVDRLMRGG